MLLQKLHIFEHFNCPLSGLVWRTEKCRREDLRGGAFSIRLSLSVLSFYSTIFHFISLVYIYFDKWTANDTNDDYESPSVINPYSPFKQTQKPGKNKINKKSLTNNKNFYNRKKYTVKLLN